MTTTPLSAALKYIEICTDTLKEDQFFSLCTEDVTVTNETLGDPLQKFSGREEVVKAFATYIFNNTRNIVVKAIGFAPVKNVIEIHLDVNEDKKVGDHFVRYNFVEHTRIVCRLVDNRYRVASIDMKIERNSLASPA